MGDRDDARTRQYARRTPHERRSTNIPPYIYTRDTVVVAVARARARPHHHRVPTRERVIPTIPRSLFRAIVIHAPRDSRDSRSLDHTRTRPDMLTVAEFIFEKSGFGVRSDVSGRAVAEKGERVIVSHPRHARAATFAARARDGERGDYVPWS